MASCFAIELPYPKLNPIQPKPSAETSKPLLPNIRFCMLFLFCNAKVFPVFCLRGIQITYSPTIIPDPEMANTKRLNKAVILNYIKESVWTISGDLRQYV